MVILAMALATPVAADTFYAYTQGGIPSGADIFTWCDTPPCDVFEPVVCDNPEGGNSLRMNTNVWGGFGVFLLGDLADLSDYDDGELRFWVKSTNELKIEFQCRPALADVTYTTFLSQTNWDGTGDWQEIQIPIADFFAPNPVDPACLANVYAPIMSTIENLPFFNSFQIDYARWVEPNTPSGASSVSVQGRQFMVDGEPFVVNAMAYAPIGIGENWQAGWADRADRYNVDFPLMKEAGANVVRLYAPIVSEAMLDAAWANGLYVIPTFGVDSIQLECPEGKAYVEDRFVEMVNDWKDHPAILAWIIGNEVNVNLGGADICNDWYPTLEAMAAAGHAAEGAAFHPMGTAIADVSSLGDACIAGCSDDTAMPSVDFWGAQIYRGCSFGSAFNDYAGKADCDRPLLLTEFGADAYDGVSGSEDQLGQDSCFDTLLAQADANLAVRTAGAVSTGHTIFEWSDEWWKAECDPGTSWFAHDTCTSFTNTGFPDPNINEEWWGLVALDSGDPGARNSRTALGSVSESWNVGEACAFGFDSFNPGTGEASLSFDVGSGSSDHVLYYGPLGDVSTYGYSGEVAGLGADGSSDVTLPSGSLFMMVVPKSNGAEGCYGLDSDGTERPASPAASVAQSATRACVCNAP
ncbi:hypothetical protein ABI59_19230 [Acidobacteria bacterium Mor1]|nr:hypothetical protein ABI59_19230 [Acidobacteria bacterium Mor1]